VDLVIVRHATMDDIEILVDLYKEFHEFHVKGVPDRLRIPCSYDDGDLSNKIEKILSERGSAIFVAEMEDAVVGLAEVYVKQDEANSLKLSYTYAHLQSVIVREAYRRQKIGRKLLLAVEQWAKENDASEIRLDIWEFKNGPLEFYEKRGYYTLRRTMVRKL
jgi:GNAT superfamily N-acetyltransferase